MNQEIKTINFQLIKQRIYDQYYQSWYSNINKSPRLHYYSIFKHSFTHEQYLNFISDKNLRFALCKFRTASHNLETGRYQNIPRAERVCKVCNMNVTESEYHFLLACPFNRTLRRQFLKPFFCRWQTLNKFEILMSSTNKKIVHNLARYINHAISLRQAALS